jgi:hypothetical protein
MSKFSLTRERGEIAGAPPLKSAAMFAMNRIGLAPFRAAARLAFTALAPLAAAGCLSFGPHTLKVDQADYARALGEAKKREILTLIVGLRYGDSPALLTVTQVISSYTFTASATPMTESVPPGPTAALTGMASYSDHPTFTFTPTTGQSYAKAYIHPLAPSLVLPLADSGVPIDLLLQITVQSIGGLSNAAMLGGPNGDGSPEFFELLAVLRRLQLAGEVSVEFVAAPNGGEVRLALGLPQGIESARNAADTARVRELLRLPAGSDPYLIAAPGAPPAPRCIPVVMRSVLGILTDLGAEIDVPQTDVENGATKPPIRLVGGEARPTVVIHAAKSISGPAYAAVRYRSSRFWIDDSDFDSKYALTVVQDLMALAEETDVSHAPIVSVPAS